MSSAVGLHQVSSVKRPRKSLLSSAKATTKYNHTASAHNSKTDRGTTRCHTYGKLGTYLGRPCTKPSGRSRPPVPKQFYTRQRLGTHDVGFGPVAFDGVARGVHVSGVHVDVPLLHFPPNLEGKSIESWLQSVSFLTEMNTSIGVNWPPVFNVASILKSFITSHLVTALVSVKQIEIRNSL